MFGSIRKIKILINKFSGNSNTNPFYIDKRFKMLNREACLISGLLTSGLENLRKISKDQSFYYLAFYSLSIGFERLMKLILHLASPDTNLRKYGHNIIKLSTATKLHFTENSIEHDIIAFLNYFAEYGRYNIVDYLTTNNSSDCLNEPIMKFYSEVMNKILVAHPLKYGYALPPIDFAHVLHINEDFSEINDLDKLFIHGQAVEHVSKYVVMYFGRLIQPLLKQLESFNGPPNPYFREHFRYLHQDDQYFLNRKKFRA